MGMSARDKISYARFPLHRKNLGRKGLHRCVVAASPEPDITQESAGPHSIAKHARAPAAGRRRYASIAELSGGCPDAPGPWYLPDAHCRVGKRRCFLHRIQTIDWIGGSGSGMQGSDLPVTIRARRRRRPAGEWHDRGGDPLAIAAAMSARKPSSFESSSSLNDRRCGMGSKSAA
jgi:hypothetical protein